MDEKVTTVLSSPRNAREPRNRGLYALSIFLSAFLLFEVQPLIAKEILPWFGGSAGVWTTCMLFFQLLLLAGYAYAHWLSRGRHRWVHTLVLAASVLMCRIIPLDAWKPPDGSHPIWRILALLTVTVGLPYFTLSATSPLLQNWYSRTHRTGMPYRFFALSNFASMLALLSYPILIEPHIRLHTQAWLWSAGFLIAALLNYGLFRQSALFFAYQPADQAASTDDAPGRRQRIIWVLLPACASALLLAVTNHITQNIAAIPLFWVVPLGVYLLSFILTFEGARWYQRQTFLALFAVALAAMGHAAALRSDVQDIKVLIPIFIGGLFIGCMVCHGELARSKPSARSLTGFYLMVALGGAIGGLFVAVVAPAVFPALLELPLLLVLTPIVILWKLLSDRLAASGRATAETLPQQEWGGVLTRLGRAPFWPLWTLSALAVMALGGYLARDEWADLSTARLLTRNFYGALRVADDDDLGVRELAHGTIIHGEQYLAPDKRRRPLTYYAADTGIGLLMTALEKQPAIRLGVIGLGTGSMAAWGRAGDVVRFYEINARVLDIARRQFTFLGDSHARIDIVLGDARLALEREPSQQFDVLVVDAFSGDSIPVHLLTREAFEVYFRHLKPDGTLAVHVSNTFLDLAPPVAAVARQLGREAHLIENDEDEKTQTYSSAWVLVGAHQSERYPWIAAKESQILLKSGLRVWTDDFSNLWQVLTIE